MYAAIMEALPLIANVLSSKVSNKFLAVYRRDKMMISLLLMRVQEKEYKIYFLPYNWHKRFCIKTTEPFSCEKSLFVLYVVICLQWDLVCDRAYLKDLTQTILIVGVMFGAMICTTLSDKFGRKPTFLCCMWTMVVVGVANAFASNYYLFAFLRFCTGLLVEVGTPNT